MNIIYISYVNLRKTTGPAINENGFLRSLKREEVNVKKITGGVIDNIRIFAAIPRVIKKVFNYLLFNTYSFIFAFKYLVEWRDALVIFRLGPMPISEALIVLFLRPNFVIKTLGSGDLEWASRIKILHLAHIMLCKYIAKRALVVDTVTADSKLLILSKLNLRSEKVTVIDNSVDTKMFHAIDKKVARNKIGLAEYTYIIGYTGNYASVRGGFEAIEVTSLLRMKGINVACLILGYDPDMDRLINLAKLKGIIDNVFIIGSVDFSSMPMYVSALDVGFSILPPKIKGASPQKVRQYVASGVRVVTTPGADNFVSDIGYGHIVDYGDIQSMNNYIGNFLSNGDDSDPKDISEYVANNLSLDKSTKERLALWRKYL